MILTPAERLVNLGMPYPLAKEIAAHINSGVGNTRNLVALGVPPLLANEIAAQITSGNGDAVELVKFGLSPELAKEVVAQIEGGGVTPTLNPLTVTPNTATVGTVFNGAVSGRTAGSTLTLTGAGAAGLSINSGTGAITGTPTTAGAVNVVETLSGAIGSPRTSSSVVTVQEGITPVANNTRLVAINNSYVSNVTAATAANLKSAQNGISVQNVLVAASSTGLIGHEFASIPEGSAIYISQGGNYVASLMFSTDSTDYVNGTWTTIPVVMKYPSRLSSATRNGDCSQLVDLPSYNVPVKVKLSFTNQAGSSSYFSAVWYATTPDAWIVLGPSLPNAACAPRSMRDLMAGAVAGSDPITLNYTVIGLSGAQVADTANEFITAYPRVKNVFFDIGGNDVTANRPYATDPDPTLMKRSYDAIIAAYSAAGKRPFGGYITYRNYPTSPAVNGLLNRGNGSRDYNNLTLAPSVKIMVPEV